ncbi:MAG: hypothetical protein PVJ47_01415 [Thiohalocapsa sp.]
METVAVKALKIDPSALSKAFDPRGDALVLAKERNPPLPMDETKGRAVAKRLGVSVLGLFGLPLPTMKLTEARPLPYRAG